MCNHHKKEKKKKNRNPRVLPPDEHNGSQCLSVHLCHSIDCVSVNSGWADRTRLPACAPSQVIKVIHTHAHTCSHAASLAAASLLWTTSRLWAPEEMTGLSLISLSSAQTSPNYSHCLPLRWHAHWIIDGRPCPSQLKGLASGHGSSQWTGRLPAKCSCVSCMTVDWIIIPTAIYFCFVFFWHYAQDKVLATFLWVTLHLLNQLVGFVLGLLLLLRKFAGCNIVLDLPHLLHLRGDKTFSPCIYHLILCFLMVFVTLNSNLGLKTTSLLV